MLLMNCIREAIKFKKSPHLLNIRMQDWIVIVAIEEERLWLTAF